MLDFYLFINLKKKSTCIRHTFNETQSRNGYVLITNFSLTFFSHVPIELKKTNLHWQYSHLLDSV